MERPINKTNYRKKQHTIGYTGARRDGQEGIFPLENVKIGK